MVPVGGGMGGGRADGFQLFLESGTTVDLDQLIE